MKPNNYQNKAMPITTGVARTLIQELFAGGDYVGRADIVERVVQYHTANGGKATLHRTVVSSVKRVLGMLETEGLAERHPTSVGYWKVHNPTSSDDSSEQTAAPALPFLEGGDERVEATLTELAAQATEMAARAEVLATELNAMAERLREQAERLT